METVLLHTKLHMPSLPSTIVPRTRLMRRLQNGLERRVTFIQAPACYGKSTLVRSWAGQLERPAGWLSLDAGDNDIFRFKRISFSIDPLLEDGTTLVQLGPLFESLGVSLDWDGSKQIVRGKKGSLVFALTIDSTTATINGKEVTLEKPARLVDGNTLVPLRFVGEATGAIVAWDGNNRKITLFSEQMVKSLGLSREEVEKIIVKNGGMVSSQQPVPTEPSDKPGSKDSGQKDEEAEAEVPVRLDDLQGMHYGLRPDISGYECGGTCWDFYTFLPDHRIVVGEPAQGGPETIDCAQQTCSAYSIKDGNLIVDGSSTVPIRVSEKGNLIVDDIRLSPVKPAAEGLKPEGSSVYRGYSGLIGINVSSSAWEERITFKKDGTFTGSNLTLGAMDSGSAETHSSASSGISGTYTIDRNTIVLKTNDGKEQKHLFFLHPGKEGVSNPKTCKSEIGISTWMRTNRRVCR